MNETTYNYPKNRFTFIYNSYATFCLGIALLIPFINNYILNEVIKQETGIKTNYFFRRFNGIPLWNYSFDEENEQ